MSEAAASTRRFDADVHVAVPSAKTLYPYLSAYWQEILTQMNFRQPPSVAQAYPPWSKPLATPGSEVTLERVRDQVLAHADAALLHCFYGVESVQHPYLAPLLASAVNRWLEEEWLACDEHLVASALIAPQYPQAAVEEIERVAENPRFVQLLLPARSLAGYGHQLYWPVWEAAAAHGLVLGIVFGGSTGTPPTPVNFLGSYFEEYAAATLNFQAQVTSLVFSGVFDRFTSLRVALFESGWTWLPSLFWRMDKEWKSAQREVPWVKGPPSDYVRRHFRVTTQPTDAPRKPQLLRTVLDELGTDAMLMHASDFPHRYPHGADEVSAVMTPAEAERVCWSNAAELYALEQRLAPPQAKTSA